MEQKKRIQEERTEALVRIMGHDIVSNKNIYTGLTKIKGIGWSVSNAVCINLKIDRKKKISDLNKEEIKKIEEFIKKLEVPDFLKNRRSDLESGNNKHLFSVELDMRKEFDIKRLKKIKSYRGSRHTAGLPSRGQRTRSHFRKVGIAVGVKRKK